MHGGQPDGGKRYPPAGCEPPADLIGDGIPQLRGAAASRAGRVAAAHGGGGVGVPAGGEGEKPGNSTDGEGGS